MEQLYIVDRVLHILDVVCAVKNVLVHLYSLSRIDPYL